MIFSRLLLVLAVSVTILSACGKDKTPEEEVAEPAASDYTAIENTYGFSILNKVKGIWSGPVTSTTMLGNFPEWIVDFRPISDNQISSKNELNSENSIYLSLFIGKYNNEYRVFLKNGGQFAGNTRVSYFYADSIKETGSQSYYRFREVRKGKDRAYTEFTFRNDSLIFKAYTNQYNALPTSTLHMQWNAKLRDLTSCQPAVTHFGFPKKTMTRDFSGVFDQAQEAIYFSDALDPYSETQQPYVGKITASVTYQAGYTPNNSNNVFFMFTTQPLFNGFTYNPSALNFRSRYVFISAADNSFVFQNMHPGTYYLYAFYDQDGNNTINSGDWISLGSTPVTLSAQGNVNASAQINFTIP